MGKYVHFNREVIEATKVPADRDRIEYRDRKEPGLYLYISRGGTKTFYLYRKFRGKPVRVKIGRYPEFSTTAARERARELKGMLARGENPREKEKEGFSHAVTLKQIGEEYLKVRDISKNTDVMYRGRLNNQLKLWHHRPIVGVTKKQLVDLHDEISRTSGKHMADITMRIFGAFYNFFMDRYDHPGPNPVKTLSVNKLWKTSVTDRRQGMISKEDMPRWFQSVMQHDGKDEKAYLLLLLVTGMRRTEAVNLRWEHVNFREKRFTVHKTKNGKPLNLPLTGFLAEMLESRLQGRSKQTGLVFPSKKSNNKPMSVTNLAAKLSKQSGVSFSLHDLRRTFITYADELELSDNVIKRLVNHSISADVTAGYIVSEVDRLRDPAERICNYILSLTTPQTERCESSA